MAVKFKIGDSVVVKPGTKDPDMGSDLGGWQGRITEIRKLEPDNDVTVEIAWDSITLRTIPKSVIIHCEREGLDWTSIGLYEHEVTLTKARDTAQDTKTAKAELSGKYDWIALGNDEEQGLRMQSVIDSAVKNPSHGNPDLAIMEAWDKHLRMTLKLPFAAEVAEFQERGSLRAGDKVTVTGFSEVDEHYGILVAIQHRRTNYHFPLADLEVSDASFPNHDYLEDYRIWFANR